MGKQIVFYMSNEDQKHFVEFIYLQGDILIEKKINENGVYIAVQPGATLVEYKYYIYNPSLKLLITPGGFIDSHDSEVIEFEVCGVKYGNKITDGRLWVEMTYYNENDEKLFKSEELDNRYKKYKKYITKNFRISNDKYHYYAGPGAYELYKKGWIMEGHSGFPIGFD